MRMNYIDNIDCLQGMKEIPDSSVDLVLADPPYGIDFQSRHVKEPNRRRSKIANDKAPFVWWLYDAARVLKDTGALVCFARWDVQELFRECIGAAGLKVQNVCVWSKGGGGMGNLKAAFTPDHEVFIFATKPGFAFPSKRPASVVTVAKVPSGKLTHPNEKPVALMCELIESLTLPSATVLDPFMGSGTTAVACIRTGRNFLGHELNADYHRLALERVAAEQEGVG